MSVSLRIVILFALVAIILPQSTTAIQCFRCTSEFDCGINEDFRSDDRRNKNFINEGCSFNPGLIPACKYVINNKSVVSERGCGGVGVTSRQPYCKNRYSDVIECYCTTDLCNGIDASGTALNAAAEHFRRQEEIRKETTTTPSAAANATWSIFSLALAMVLSLICG